MDRSIESHLSQQDASQHLGLFVMQMAPGSNPILQEACCSGDQRQKLRHEDGQTDWGKECQGLPVAPLGAHQQHKWLLPCAAPEFFQPFCNMHHQVLLAQGFAQFSSVEPNLTLLQPGSVQPSGPPCWIPLWLSKIWFQRHPQDSRFYLRSRWWIFPLLSLSCPQ